ncbi:DUF3488 domain-containing protein [Rhodoferax sp.]|uniref:DUF3488 domain-containing protein n=1 Tax=Rhodoferax sp. TaxID=50421 RepID=UPI002724D452|nr:transglutaminaseTgpA domain-containing protein [Rhodoferax sp.]MDO9198177.1 transglutaminaseTgpA domain-containing protein [Rhodoferax sp.]
MTTTRTVPVPVDPASPLNSRAVVALTGMSYFFVALGFSYLDRRFSSFGVEGFLWLTWAVLGFGAGTLHAGKPVASGQTQWVVLGLLGFVLALFPGLAIYNLLRWTCLTLMIVIGARAAILRTRRDFYLTLTVIFVVSFMVGTHGNADWTLWFYLGPAWVFGGLALAWEHAAGVRLSRWTKMAMTLGFVGASFLLAVVLFFFAPRPPILGFGFLPPGTDTPGLFQQPVGEGGGRQAKGNSGSSGSGAGAGQGSAGAPQPGEWAQKWGAMLKSMRQSTADRFIPQWQRSLMEKLLNSAQSLLGMLTGRSAESEATSADGELTQEQSESLLFKVNWLWVLVALLAGYFLWRRRYRIGLGIALGCSWLLAAHFPAQSMRVSAQAMKWCLHIQGHKRSPGQSVREHWLAAAGIAPLANKWLGYAVQIYCETRFGAVSASQQRALNMRRAVQGACDILIGFAPELKK